MENYEYLAFSSYRISYLRKNDNILNSFLENVVYEVNIVYQGCTNAAISIILMNKTVKYGIFNVEYSYLCMKT